MSVDFTSIHNHNENAVYASVLAESAQFPAIESDNELLADVACVALNRLQPRYIRHTVDFTFYQSDRERIENQQQVEEAVRFAFGFVQARVAMRART